MIIMSYCDEKNKCICNVIPNFYKCYNTNNKYVFLSIRVFHK